MAEEEGAGDDVAAELAVVPVVDLFLSTLFLLKEYLLYSRQSHRGQLQRLERSHRGLT